MVCGERLERHKILIVLEGPHQLGMKEGGEGGGIGMNSGSGSVALRPLAFRPGLAQRINTPPPLASGGSTEEKSSQRDRESWRNGYGRWGATLVISPPIRSQYISASTLGRDIEIAREMGMEAVGPP